MTRPKPKVFISYSQDSDAHKNLVLDFADRLCEGGINCSLDQYETFPSGGWAEWSSSQLESVDFVLVVCTEGYSLKASSELPQGTGSGTKWEANSIRNAYYQGRLKDRVIPVVFSAPDAKYIPTYLVTMRWFVVGRDDEDLYRCLTGQGKRIKPRIGKVRSLLRRKNKRTFIDTHDEVIDPAADGEKRYAVDEFETRRPPNQYLLSSYLDRRDQVRGFHEAMESHYSTNPHRPLVCIIHGDENECHPYFITRIRQLLLPAAFARLGLASQDDVLCERQPMKLPLGVLDQGNYKQILWENLRKAFCVYGLDSQKDFRRLITQKKSAAIIEVQLETRHWDGIGVEKLNWFLKFWDDEDWQGLPENFLLLVCLSCEYAKEPEKGVWKSGNPNGYMRAYIEGLDDKRFQGVYVARINELMAIERDDARALLNEADITRCYDFAHRDIDKLYKKLELCIADGRIPMAHLLEELDTFRRTQGSSHR